MQALRSEFSTGGIDVPNCFICNVAWMPCRYIQQTSNTNTSAWSCVSLECQTRRPSAGAISSLCPLRHWNTPSRQLSRLTYVHKLQVLIVYWTCCACSSWWYLDWEAVCCWRDRSWWSLCQHVAWVHDPLQTHRSTCQRPTPCGQRERTVLYWWMQQLPMAKWHNMLKYFLTLSIVTSDRNPHLVFKQRLWASGTLQPFSEILLNPAFSTDREPIVIVGTFIALLSTFKAKLL